MEERLEQALSPLRTGLRSSAESDGERFFKLSVDLLATASLHNGHWRRLNPAFHRTLGWGEAEMLDRSFLDLVHAEDQARSREAVGELATGKCLVGFENRIRCNDGSYKRVAWNMAPDLDEGLFYCVGREFADRGDFGREAFHNSELSRHGLTELEELYRTAPIGLCVLDPDLRYIRLNERMAGINGIPAAHHLGKTVRDLMPQLADAVEPNLRHILATGEPRLNVELVAETPAQPGVQRTWMEQWLPLKDADGHVIGLSIVVEEITARKQVEEALRSSEERLRLFIAYAPAGIAMFDREMRYLAASRRWLNDYHATGDVIGRSHYEVFPDVPGQWKEVHRRAFAGETLHSDGDRFERADGSVQWVKWDVLPWHNAAGEIGGLLMAAEEISERKQAEEELRIARNRLETALHASQVVLFHQDRELRYTWIHNPAFGYRAEEVVGKRDADLLQGAGDAARIESIKRSVMESGMARREEVAFVTDGESRYYDLVVQPDRDANGVIAGVNCAAIDVTVRKRAEEQLREADRKKDHFLAMLAHELRNPLAPIRSGLESMKLAGNDVGRVVMARDMMERQVNQMSRLIDDLMDVNRISRGMISLQKTKVRLAEVLRDAVDASRPLIEAKGHQLIVDLPPEPITVDGDLTRLSQVFANLLNNAAKYTGKGGRIRLAAQSQGNDVVVSIRDNGIGIPASMLSSVFEMFAQVDRSLERSQGGLGLGLSIARWLVEMHGGHITAESGGQGLGSTFTVRLPVVPSVPDDKPDHDSDSDAKRQPAACRILVVDDNRDGAVSLAMMLNLLGYETQTAYDGPEGVAMAETFRPDVILMDIGMPKLNGFEACRRIREQPWGRRIMIVAQTGWGQEETRREAMACGFDHHLIKPIDPAALRTLLAGIRMRPG